MEKWCTNKNHSYKHNEQINKQNIDNSECFGVKYIKIYKVLVKLLQQKTTCSILHYPCLGLKPLVIVSQN